MNVPSTGDYRETGKLIAYTCSQGQFKSCVKKPDLLPGFFVVRMAPPLATSIPADEIR